MSSVAQDEQGFIWFGTADGLNQFDGIDITSYRNLANHPDGIGNTQVVEMVTDKAGQLWIATETGKLNHWRSTDNSFAAFGDSSVTSIQALTSAPDGTLLIAAQSGQLISFDPRTRQFTTPGLQLNDLPLSSGNYITALAYDRHGNLWLGTRASGFYCYNTNDHSLLAFDDNGYVSDMHGSSDVRHFLFDRNGNVWVATFTHGVYQLNNQQPSLGAERILSDTAVYVSAEDHRGHIWMGSYQEGLWRYQPQDKTLTQFKNDVTNPNSLPSDTVFSLMLDRSEQLWVGTDNGAARLNINAGIFGHYIPTTQNTLQINQSVILESIQGHDGNLWLGTFGGGLVKFDLETNQFQAFIAGNANNGISNNDVLALAGAQNGLWIGTRNGVDFLEYSTELITHHGHPQYPGIDNGAIVTALLADENRLWVGTYQSGLYVIDMTGSGPEIYRHDSNTASISSNSISDIFRTEKGAIWVLTDSGLNLFDPRSKNFQRFFPTSQSHRISTIWEAPNEHLWLGTKEGVIVIDASGNSIKKINRNHGLSNNDITGIQGDTNGHIWISTNYGLNRYSPGTGEIKTYYQQDGLQSNEFNLASTVLSDGRLVFGGINGFNLFDPQDIVTDRTLAEPVITDVTLIGPKTTGMPAQLERQTTGNAYAITLEHIYYGLDIYFNGLHYKAPHRNQYRYMLEGLDKDWFSAQGQQRSARYTNLTPGQYDFKLQVANSDGVWNPKTASLHIQVLPPWWKTIWAYMLYVVLVLLAAIALFLWRTRALRQYAQRLEHDVAERTSDIAQQKSIIEAQVEELKSLDKAKEQFFENISHEFRTPLTIIISSLKRMLPDISATRLSEYRDAGVRNAARLLRLINKLLDISRLQSGALKLKPAVYALDQQIRRIAEMFQPELEKKNHHLELQLQQNLLLMYDEMAMEEMLLNLISNANKFTPNGGTITIKAYTGDNGQAVIKIIDTGPGIPPDEQPFIFQRFQQSSVHQHQQGTGIGLSLVEELTQLHGGEVTLTSKPGEGCCFTLTFPGVVTDAEAASFSDDDELNPARLETIAQTISERATTLPPVTMDDEKPIILIVDDEPDMRHYLAGILEGYQVLTAENGKIGYELALEHLPDLIISDIMMPVMDGLELSRLLREAPQTSHIPIILLTARGSQESKLEGLREGVNDYIVKPFDEAELLIRISNLLSVRDTYAKKYGEQSHSNSNKASTIPVAEQKFLQMLDNVLQENYAKPSLTISEIADRMAMSERQLQRKLKAAFDQKPIEYLKVYRLHIAAKLLRQGHNVTKTYEASGFSSMSHFSRCFKAYYGVAPSQYNNLKH